MLSDKKSNQCKYKTGKKKRNETDEVKQINKQKL